MEVVLALHLYGIPWPLLRPSSISRKRKDGWNQEQFPRLRVLLPGWSGQLKGAAGGPDCRFLLRRKRRHASNQRIAP
jgi:hypothetical protein